jgi:hypothetical protein
MANEQQAMRAEFLVEQYKLPVDYRKYLGALLLQMTGGVCERRPLEDDCTVVEVNYIGEGAFG